MKYLFSLLFLLYFCAVSTGKVFAVSGDTLWKYQCIDTMKISRDQARSLGKSPYRLDTIDTYTRTIADMGANCIAIATPYDEEFLPFLTDWVNAARKYNLHVWFRGNFSGWEGWFDYKDDPTPNELLARTKKFIITNQDLFKDGDIFTPAPEAENGWTDKKHVSQEEYPEFRRFLIGEYTTAKAAFDYIDKQVEVNWLSMSGGVAKAVFDKQTVSHIGNTVTIDHYVKDPSGMDEFIAFFVKRFNAKIVFGEFGAPIPDLNGNMNEDEQAAFVDQLLYRLYVHKDVVDGLNYWVIQDGSTALLHADNTPRKVVDIIKTYFKPAIVTGKVVDPLGTSLEGITIEATDGVAKTHTDKKGQFRFLIPSDTVTLTFVGDNYAPVVKTYTLEKGQLSKHEIILDPISKNFWYKLREFIRNLAGR